MEWIILLHPSLLKNENALGKDKDAKDDKPIFWKKDSRGARPSFGAMHACCISNWLRKSFIRPSWTPLLFAMI